jgi:cell division septation protein DedD
MADKIEYSRMLVKRTAQTGEVPTVPPITAVTLNQMIPTDLFVGEFFLNEVDDLLWIRTENGILPISLSGSTGSTSTQNLTETLFYGNATNGYNIEVSAGDTIQFQGLSTGSTKVYLGLDSSGNTIAVIGASGGGDTLWTSGSSVGSVVGIVGNNTNTAEYALIVGRNNTASESQTGFTGGNIIIGSGNTFNGIIGQVFGYQNTNLGLRNFIGGTQHYINSADSAILGGGSNRINGPLRSFIAGGSENQILGTVGREDNAIIGGTLNVLNGVERSVIIGGESISGSSNDMVYVPNLTIVSATTGTAVAHLAIDSTGKVITTNSSGDDAVPYNLAVPLSTSSNLTRYISPVQFTISDIKANVFPAPGSENLQIDILKNGTSIFASGNIITINSGQTTNQGSDPYTLDYNTFYEWDNITFSATSFSGTAIVYINGCQVESCVPIITPTPTTTPPPTPTPTPTATATATPTPTPTFTPTASTSGDADAAAYLAAVVATGGTVDGTITTAVNNLFTSLKSAGIYSKLDILMPMVGGTAASMVINAKTPTNNTYKWTAYGSPLTYDVSGITGNLTGVLKSNFKLSGLTQAVTGNCHTGVYYNQLSTIGSGGYLNGYIDTAGAPYLYLNTSVYGSNLYGSQTGSQSFNVAHTPARGWWYAQRSAANSAQWYSSNSLVQNNTSTATFNVSEQNQNLALFGLGWITQPNGIYTEGGNARIATYTVGSSLTSGERTDLYNIIVTFNTALSRN